MVITSILMGLAYLKNQQIKHMWSSEDAIILVSKSMQELNRILGDPKGWVNIELTYFFMPVESQEDFESQYAQHHATIIDDIQFYYLIMVLHV